jgi:methylamine dehydrogenase heavy chain
MMGGRFAKAFWASGLLLTTLYAAPIPADEGTEPETYGIATLPLPAPPHRFITMGGFGSSTFTIFDGDSGKMEGNISAGYIPNFASSPDGTKFYVSETYWTHGTRGPRQDIVTVYDAKTLAVEKEIPIPSRALVNQLHNFGLSLSGHRGYVYAMQPASSVVWLDLKTETAGGTIDLPGCSMIYPIGDEGFASLCGDGSLATTLISDKGQVTTTKTKPFFDANKDPIFDDSVTDTATGKAFFVSFTGLVYEAKLGATPTIEKPWSMQQAAGLPVAGTGVKELTWRPGGHQMITYHKASGKLFVIMHMGNYWTQDAGGSEIWVLDTKKHSLISRFPLWAVPTSGSAAKTKPVYFRNIQVSQDEHPVIFLLNYEGNDMVLDATTGKVIRKIEAASGGAVYVSGM